MVAEVWDVLFEEDPTTKRRPVRPAVGETEDLKAWNNALKKGTRLIETAAGCSHKSLTAPFLTDSNAIGMWDAVIDHYAKKNCSERFRIFLEIMNLKKSPDMSWPSFCQLIHDKVEHLTLMNATDFSLNKVYDEFKLFTLLANLPSTGYMRSQILTSNDTSYDHAKEVILANQDNNLPTETASLAASAAPRECPMCKQKNHTLKDCWHFKKAKGQYYSNLCSPNPPNYTPSSNNGANNRRKKKGGQANLVTGAATTLLSTYSDFRTS